MNRSSVTQQSHQASTKQNASAQGGAAAAGAAPAPAPAPAAGAQEERTNYLVALAGMRALTAHVNDTSKGKNWIERVKGWEEKAGLTEPSVKLALGFLDKLGVSRAAVYKQLLENALRVLLDKIPHLEEERMLLLLNDSFRYATQAELKSVPLKIISSMSVVPDKVLFKIIELQTHEPSKYEELGLPLAIKRLAWEKDTKLFMRIVSPHAEKYIASEFCPKMILSSQQVRFYRSLDTIKRRKVMGPERIDALAECTGGRPILIGYLCDFIADRFKAETSLSKAGLWATLLTDVLVTARERAYGNIPDQSVDRLCALASRLDLAVREDVFNDTTVRDVQRLFRLATGIGEGQQDASTADRRDAKHEDGNTKLQKTLKTAWSSVSKMDKNKWFKEPVTESIAKGYHSVIKTPMDLGTILKKIKGGGYPSFGDFDRDLKLMWKNCRTYNREGTKYNAEAQRQEKEWSKMSAKIEESLRHQEPPNQSRPGHSAGANTSTSTIGNKRKSSTLSHDDARGAGGGGGAGGGAALPPMAPATQLDRQGLGRRVGLASILLSEPFVAKLMYRHASDRVPEACAERGLLPRDHPVYAPLLQLLDLGDYARPMFRAGTFGVRAVEGALTRTVLPCVVALHARAEGAVAAARRGGGGSGSGGGPKDAAAADNEENSAVDAATAKEEDDKAAAGQEWRAWYKEFPAVRRLICTMLCRALVRGSNEAAALLMPAASAAVKRMGDQQWLWASLADLLQKSADAAAAAAAEGGEVVVNKSAKDKGAATRVLKSETMLLILKLFSIGLESATVSDVVFSKALQLVANLLPFASPESVPVPSAGPGTSTTKGADSMKSRPSPAAAKGDKPSTTSAAVLPRSALEDVLNQAAVRATRPPRRPRTEAEEERVKKAFAEVFVKAPPGWANKLSEFKAKHAEKSKNAAVGGKGSGSGSKGGGGDGNGFGGAGVAGVAGGGGGMGRAPRPISIKGPKREREETFGGASSGGGEPAAAVRKKKSRRVNV